MSKKAYMKLLSFLMTFVMVFEMLPLSALATKSGKVYITISDEGQFIEDQNGDLMAGRSVELKDLNEIDLDQYGLSDYKYDHDNDGQYEITALHLYIYVHEQLLGLDFADVDTSNGSPASMYFSSGLFGFEDENMRYDYNGSYPADENGWGITADNIVLKNGDYLDIAHYSDWQFYYDSAYGFNYFTNENGKILHDFTAETETKMNLKVLLVGGGMGFGSMERYQADYTVYYGKTIGDAYDSVETDAEGTASISFPSPGIWYIWCDGGEGEDACYGSVVSSPASAKVTVTGESEDKNESDKNNTEIRDPQDISDILEETLEQLADTVTEPQFGTNAGEWTVLSLARGGYYDIDDDYFLDYYDRIVETVNKKAASIDQNGALHKSKSTDNSRLIVALSAIGKDAASVGNWDLTAPYDNFDWIENQGINGVIWALIALDTNDYETDDDSIRQQCIDYILDAELENGGWALSGSNMDVDITGMTLQALYPYRKQNDVHSAAERAFNRLSNEQQESGGFLYGNSETAESAAQVIVACTTWGINPDTDSRFIKDDLSVIDALLEYYVEDEAMFEHQLGAGTNNMATDQACYAMVAYERFLNDENALYDMSDVFFENSGDNSITSDDLSVSLGLPKKINTESGSTFNATLAISSWDNTAGYKLVDLIMSVPEGLKVTDVTSGDRFNGGEVSYHLEESAGKLRIVYFDAANHTDLTLTGTEFPATLFTISFEVDDISKHTQLNFSILGMSIKCNSDPAASGAQIIVNSDNASGSILLIDGISFSAIELYEGDDVDLIPSTKKAVAVAVTGLEEPQKLVYVNGSELIMFRYSSEISTQTGISSYVALVDSDIATTNFADAGHYTLNTMEPGTITFGDSNDDGTINAQDALAAVDAWLRKSEEPTDKEILAMNVNGDSRINTFDALGIVESFVNNSAYGVVTKAALLAATGD